MTNEDARKILEAVRAEPVPKTMLDELTESQQKIVLATLHGVEMIIDRRNTKQQAETLQGVKKILEEEDTSIRKRLQNILKWIASQV